jgi:hypothetical protein
MKKSRKVPFALQQAESGTVVTAGVPDDGHLIGDLRSPCTKSAMASNVPLEALPASRSLVVLHSCPFVRLVTANNAACRCAKDAMVTGKMARSTAHDSAF